MGEKGKLFLTVECQLINVERLIDKENHHLAITTVVTDKSTSCQWRSDEEQDVTVTSEYFPQNINQLQREKW